MNAVPPPMPGAGIPGLVAEALRGTGDVVRGEIALFRQEMADNLRSLVIGLASVAGAAVFAVVGLLVLIDALVKWFATVVHSEALSALIVGAGLFALALILALTARSKFALGTLAPTRTGRQLKRDADVIREQVEA